MASKRLLAIPTSVLKQIQRAEHTADLSQIYPRLGNRDIVGHGMNGFPGYMDMVEFPAPAVRFKENTKEVMALREKEMGDWHNLSLQEKKELYRNSFCQTLVELQAPSGMWKQVVAGFLTTLTCAIWAFMYVKTYVTGPLPHTITREWQEAQVERMVRERSGPYTGVSSKWDYEKNQWK